MANEIVPGVAYYVNVHFNMDHPAIKRRKDQLELIESDPIATFDEAIETARYSASRIVKGFKMAKLVEQDMTQVDDEYHMILLDARENPIARLGVIQEDYRQATFH